MSRVLQGTRKSKGGDRMNFPEANFAPVAAGPSDDRFTRVAFDAYRSAHGIHDSRRLGDMPLQVVSEVLQAAQKLKEARP
jgi:hypothetical protein